jgi:regulator of protease activity HflC (stomatin/prohibitin superfamily)/type IV secretory pathway VirB2 component (pilin)
MNKRNKKTITPPRLAALVTGFGLVACALGSFWLYKVTVYTPILLVGLMLLLPALVNLLLLIPFGEPKAAESVAVIGAQDEDGAAVREKRLRAAFAWLKRLCRRGMTALRSVWYHSRASVMAFLIVALAVGLHIVFWPQLKAGGISLLGYHVPVILLALFVLFIVLDKWCKHTGDLKRRHGTEEAGEADPYHQAVLHSLRGALSVGRLALLSTTVVLMIRLLGYGDLQRLATIIIGVLLVYETAFLLISLSVRVIRHEMYTAPELSIPMPGLGGEDLGVLAYLEKNTGITMRSLWSIKLIKNVLPYSLIAVVLLLWGFSGVVKVEAYQEGAHYRLGKLQEETLQPGLHMTLPWPFDTVEIYDTKTVSNMTIGYVSDRSTDNIWTDAHGKEEYSLLLGGGKELVSINLRVEYRVDDLKAYLRSSASPDLLLQAAAYEAVTARTINTDLETLLATDRTAFAESFQRELIDRIAVHNTGITVVSVVLESIHPPMQIADVYQELVSAGIRAEQIVLQAQCDANVAVINANNFYDTIITDAKVNQHRDIAAARSEVAAFMASAEADAAYPETYRYYKYLQAVTAAYSDARVVIVGDGVNSENIYIGNIPLTK